MRRRKQEKRRNRSKRQFGTVLSQKKNSKSKFWLISMHQSEILYIVTRNLHQNAMSVAAMSKSALIANFGQN